jgi:hypothetical protein
LDPDIIPAFGKLPAVVLCEEGIHFVDPLQAGFIEWLASLQREGPFQEFIEAGIPSPTGLMRVVNGFDVLKSILEMLKQQIRTPLHEKEWIKVAWQFDRVAKRLGVPLASSYPRIRPGEAQ